VPLAGCSAMAAARASLAWAGLLDEPNGTSGPRRLSSSAR
jgi:hypothetical protein